MCFWLHCANPLLHRCPHCVAGTGKSTFVNALVGAAVSETNFGRTTEEINVFRLHSKSMEPAEMVVDLDPTSETKKRPFSSKDEELEYIKRFRSAEDTLTKIEHRNEELKKSPSPAKGKVQTFDLLVAKLPISMRENTQLCIIESPGLNLSIPDHKEFRTYFEENWETMDAVVLVIDARVSADSEDQMENAQFVHTLLEKKKIPVYVLCNKVSTTNVCHGYAGLRF
jgi:Dynamin family